MTTITRTEREFQRHMAVLSPDGVMMYGTGNPSNMTSVWTRLPHAGQGMSLTDLVAVAARAGVRAVWLLPGTELATASPQWWQVSESHFSFASTADGATHPTAILCRDKTISGGEVMIVDLGRDGRWPWSDPGTERLAAFVAIAWLEWLLGIPLLPGPGATGWRLVEHLNAGHPEWLVRPEHLNMWPRPSDRALSYLRALEAPGDLWVHLYDANGAYLAAAQSAPLGVGQATRDPHYHAKEAGTWAVRRAAGMLGARAGIGLAPIVTDGWYDTASVRAAIEAGQGVQVYDGWAYQESHTILRSWSDTLWRARLAIVDEPVAREAIKRIYVQMIGRMNHPPREGVPSPAWYRPDWWAAIIGEWNRRLVAKVATLHIPPWLIDTDTIGIVSPEADPEAAAPQLLTRRLGLGGYKHQLTLPVTADVVEASCLGSASRCVRRLELLAAER
jgi:hypothetical protein